MTPPQLASASPAAPIAPASPPFPSVLPFPPAPEASPNSGNSPAIGPIAGPVPSGADFLQSVLSALEGKNYLPSPIPAPAPPPPPAKPKPLPNPSESTPILPLAIPLPLPSPSFSSPPASYKSSQSSKSYSPSPPLYASPQTPTPKAPAQNFVATVTKSWQVPDDPAEGFRASKLEKKLGEVSPQSQSLPLPNPASSVQPPPNTASPALSSPTPIATTPSTAGPAESFATPPSSAAAEPSVIISIPASDPALSPSPPNADIPLRAPAPIQSPSRSADIPPAAPHSPSDSTNPSPQFSTARQFFPSPPAEQPNFPIASGAASALPSTPLLPPLGSDSSLQSPFSAQNPNVPPDFSNPKAFSKTAVLMASSDNGIAAAKPVAQMKTLAQEEPAAIASQKTLAAADSEAASVSSAPSSENTNPSKTGHDHTALDIDLNSPAPNPAHAVHENEPSPAAPAAGRATNPTERCASLIEHQVAHLRHFGSDSLSVILRPDRHTELSLHLATRDGAIQASVRFERGDLPFLQSHWSELQEKLAQQNIRLAPLRESAHAQPSLSLNHQSLTNSNHSQLPQRRPQNIMAPEQELAWTGSPTEPIKHRAPARSVRSGKVRGWESWA